MATEPNPASFLLLLLLLLLPSIFATGKKFHITDDLRDVVDDEEDEAWKEWGKKKTSDVFDPPPSDMSGMELEQIQEAFMKRTMGPVFGFVKLRPGVKRTPDTVADLARKWTKMLRAGAMELNLMGIDRSTIMFNMAEGRRSLELKEFVLNQPEAYEIKIGDNLFRRKGDPPLEQVIEQIHRAKNEASDGTVEEEHHEREEEEEEDPKDEL
ncbi:unnamed protein product [Linum tenue]|uniref:Mesoderm development candidate 2 n=1 Tax=Linum tenue TaxID=586396 RepID=A0AAV0NJE4_9ROSI|nr:unnamed protein product [Linum tenue]